MKYFLNLYSPETYERFSHSDKSISGFRISQRNAAEKIQPGDRFLCYLTKISRWVGILEVESKPYEDSTPFYYESEDPFILRFKVKPVVWLERDQALPIHEDFLWNKLTFTKGQDKKLSTWTGKIRASLACMDPVDAQIISKALEQQNHETKIFPVDEKEYSRHIRHKVRTERKIISVSVPDNTPEPLIQRSGKEARDSIRVQSMIAEMGFKMGFKIWAPRSDRAALKKEISNDSFSFIETLPLNYDDTTLQTIENIDVLWLNGRSIARAFEVEHTTSIYSGILRMADLLALQPNMDIKLHIVAPIERREKVFSEVKRPVFSLLDRGPLSEYCTYLSYEAVDDLIKQPHLSHLSDTVLDEYVEQAD